MSYSTASKAESLDRHREQLNKMLARIRNVLYVGPHLSTRYSVITHQIRKLDTRMPLAGQRRLVIDLQALERREIPLTF